MAKYKKKALVEAEPYKPGMEDGYDCYRISPICTRNNCAYCDWAHPYINTLEGKHYITSGDYILTGIKNERWPCKKDIFEETYELVEDN